MHAGTPTFAFCKGFKVSHSFGAKLGVTVVGGSIKRPHIKVDRAVGLVARRDRKEL
jgi:hypothetical protein